MTDSQKKPPLDLAEKFVIHLPIATGDTPSLLEIIKTSAARSGRSVNCEIVYRLQTSYGLALIGEDAKATDRREFDELLQQITEDQKIQVIEDILSRAKLNPWDPGLLRSIVKEFVDQELSDRGCESMKEVKDRLDKILESTESPKH